MPDLIFVAGYTEALRWLLRPVSDLSVPVPAANITDFNRVSSNMGAAVAYAMTYAYQATVSPLSFMLAGETKTDLFLNDVPTKTEMVAMRVLPLAHPHSLRWGFPSWPHKECVMCRQTTLL